MVTDDRVVWKLSSDRRFSVSSLCNKVMHIIASHGHLLIPNVWLKLTPVKTELFMWFAMLDRLPTRD